jgi:hypothetical protein
VATASPALVALSVTVTPHRARARELADDYASACGDVPWIVGGSGVNEIADLIRARGGVVAPEETAALRTLVRIALDGASSKRSKPRRGKP